MVDWSHWHNEPLLITSLVLIAWLYALAVGPWRFRLAPGEPFPGAGVRRFATGLIVFYLAVGSPLDQIGERFLFSAHMVQHMIIVYLAAPLVLAGLPHWLIDWTLRPRPLQAIARFLTRPVLTAVIYVVCLSAWHIPALYDHALRVKLVHVSQHLCFFAAAVLMWWPLISPSALAPRRPPGTQILYVFGMGILQFPLVAFLNFSREVLYPTYEFAPRLTALSPREDQVLGGAIMGVGGMFIALGLISWSFYHWHRQSAAAEPEPALSSPAS